MNVREWALPVYTILMQLSEGTFLLLWVVRAINAPRLGQTAINRIVKIPVAIIFLTILIAIIGSHFHLSQPLRSFLAVLNFRSSWLSREIVFTLLFSLTIVCLLGMHWLVSGNYQVISVLGWLTIIFGIVMVYCMSQIYLLPTQTAWNSPVTIFSFYVTVLVLGLIALPAILLIDLSFSTVLELQQFEQRTLLVRQVLIWSTYASIVAWMVMVALNIYQISLLHSGDQWAQTSFDLLINLYLPLLIMRLILPLAGIIWLTTSLFRVIKGNRDIKELMAPVYSACISVLVGEILGRFLFYATHIRIGI
jgi:anaerobic dimethyl sulfoxide reductase subunit C